MSCSIGIEHIECRAATIKDAPDVTLLKIALLDGRRSFLDLLGQIFKGILEHEVHLVVNGADEVLLLLLDFD